MTRTTTKVVVVVAGIAVAALAATGVAALVNYRRGLEPDSGERAQLDELDARLDATAESGSDAQSRRIVRVFDNLLRNQGIPVARLRRWIAGVRQGTLSAEQVTAAESDFSALEREADLGGV